MRSPFPPSVLLRSIQLIAFLSILSVTSALAPLLQIWRPLPHISPDNASVERRKALATGAAVASGLWGAATAPASAASDDSSASQRSVVAIESHGSIPVWPSWAGGRVVPISMVRTLTKNMAINTNNIIPYNSIVAHETLFSNQPTLYFCKGRHRHARSLLVVGPSRSLV